MFGLFRKSGSEKSSEPAQNRQNLIELKNIVKAYDTAAGEFLALKSINLQVTAGEFVAVIGKSGSGKSTLINMITGIDRPTSGEANVTGAAVHTMTEGQIARWRGLNVGVVFQFFQLLPTWTVLENVMLPMDFCGLYGRAERKRRASDLLDLVDLGDQIHKLPTTLSGGQQQRAAIARALANDPPLLVADEPTGNLDSKTADVVIELFSSMVDQGKTILMVTHDEDLAARATRTLTIADGLIVSDSKNGMDLQGERGNEEQLGDDPSPLLPHPSTPLQSALTGAAHA